MITAGATWPVQGILAWMIKPPPLPRRAIIALLLAGTAPALAASPTPVGLWRQVDERNGQARSLVRLFQQGDTLYGRVERIFDPAQAAERCDACPGDMRGQPVLGLVLLRGLTWDGDAWSGGTIVDPETGHSYRCTIRVSDDGRRLTIRGYLGVALLGRSQTWHRDT